jgi:hypothetical protein
MGRAGGWSKLWRLAKTATSPAQARRLMAAWRPVSGGEQGSCAAAFAGIPLWGADGRDGDPSGVSGVLRRPPDILLDSAASISGGCFVARRKPCAWRRSHGASSVPASELDNPGIRRIRSAPKAARCARRGRDQVWGVGRACQSGGYRVGVHAELPVRIAVRRRHPDRGGGRSGRSADGVLDRIGRQPVHGR